MVIFELILGVGFLSSYWWVVYFLAHIGGCFFSSYWWVFFLAHIRGVVIFEEVALNFAKEKLYKRHSLAAVAYFEQWTHIKMHCSDCWRGFLKLSVCAFSVQRCVFCVLREFYSQCSKLAVYILLAVQCTRSIFVVYSQCSIHFTCSAVG